MTLSGWRKTGVVVAGVVALLILSVLAYVNYVVVQNTKSQLYSDVNLIPKNKVGVVLGTAKYKDKARKIINPYYQYRIDATVALYMAGKIDVIIVSGDNSSVYYDEPMLMRDDLVARGIPENHIYRDNAGFRTLDSILRCRDIFGQTSFTIISQKFHNERALYISNHKKLNCVAFNAKDGEQFILVTIREKLARVKMMLDLVLNTQARFYGEHITIK